ncbi:carboxyvinyl-carboxyphosphonate phosphorylmutase [Streptomyces chrestomyceticus JCM 4735]|uniref:Carboxyvinyl-carboxyphosphonate phosphorylmutase n=1 Tax=Streptomyces chrestomyceticus JCM 4735 TaxID=1306181 RepID=A0A7U9L4C0_9ACTN|nr:isocitrate lyase/phosphoenolpyruvate mutase family protein [Streptomyces chrestomyceticus]GCD40157.1 carboxyvinyl-carboxyphosphonate phosphorylmutase [Streptomyces chrestomyceticus JCM 4735]
MSENATTTNKSARLRELLAGPRPVAAVGAHDGLSAKLVEQAGFDAVWCSSFEVSASYGLPDASLVTMTQFLAAAEAMDAIIDIPVIADCDTGFGGPLNVAFAVERYERAGIAAMCIEDKLFPKINSFADAGQDLLPTKEFALKIEAGKQTQKDERFLLIARTEALISGQGVPEALERAHAYADAGADAVLVHSKSRRPDDILELGDAWDRDVPLVAVPTTYASVEEKALFDAGYRLVIYANQGMRAAVKNMREVLGKLRVEGRAESVDADIATMPEIFALQGMTAAFRTAP